MAAMLHDVGKVAISDLILKKPARLTIDEFEIMKTHTYLGADLFRNLQSDFDVVALEVALTHHEKWDGSQDIPVQSDSKEEINAEQYFDESSKYSPKKGKDIPLFGRIVAIADVYDALCSQRVYKNPWNEEEVIREIKNCSGTHFDPDLVDAFFDCYDMLKAIAKKYPDDKE